MVIDAEFEEIDNAGSSDELDLSDTDSLPWLEADEEDEDAGGVDTVQVIGFIVVLLALLLGIVAAIYLMVNRGGDAAIEPDGSTIAAPEGPIKERPENPGGKEFAGTGNVAPAVGEGQAPEGQISDGSSTSTETVGASADGANTATDADPAPEPATGGAYVQLAAYGTRSRAESGWSSLSRQTAALSGKRYRIVEAQVGGATVYRLQVVVGDRAEANTLCSAIKADGLDCAVK